MLIFIIDFVCKSPNKMRNESPISRANGLINKLLGCYIEISIKSHIQKSVDLTDQNRKKCTLDSNLFLDLFYCTSKYLRKFLFLF